MNPQGMISISWNYSPYLLWEETEESESVPRSEPASSKKRGKISKRYFKKEIKKERKKERKRECVFVCAEDSGLALRSSRGAGGGSLSRALSGGATRN